MAKTSLKVRQSRPAKFKVRNILAANVVDAHILFTANSTYVAFVLEISIKAKFPA